MEVCHGLEGPEIYGGTGRRRFPHQGGQAPNLSQPALSKWLRDLEQELGLSLVIRSRQGLIFTEAGQIYLEGCRECLEAALDIRRKLDALSQKAKQSIILGGKPHTGAPRLLPKYFRISDVSIRISTCSL